MGPSPVTCRPLTLKAPAKINWSLYVLDKRADNYHNILSLMQCIGLYDELTFCPSEQLEVVTDMDIPAEQNLVFKAAQLLQQKTPTKKGARIVLKKEIPSGAGLGGGSSDAACTLSGLSKLWDLGLDRSRLKAMGSTLGSDVPFFFDCPSAMAGGRGEILTPLDIVRPYTLLLVKPSISVSTAWAYGAREGAKRLLELTKTGDNVDNIKLIFEAINNSDLSILKSLVHNDFEDTVIQRYPVIGALKEGLLEAGAALALMSGSGSTVFGLFKDRPAAVRAAGRFSGHWSRVVETLTSAGTAKSAAGSKG